ncbi:GldG family protein [Murimonas intestini]|uniref:GldG family protein n=1 Tax=Murimonas intestini TaxID=1337051 RepID=UPI0011DD6676|nr:Gldg family protein [Murimonas intestini]
MKIKEILPRWSNKKIKNGSYSIGMTAFVIAVIIVLNLIAGELPSKYTKLDMSDEQLYSLGSQTEQIAEALDKDVTLYYIAESGNEDPTLKEVLDRYADLSGHIKVVQKDPVLYPNFTSQYTDDKVSSNSIIAVCGEQSKIIPYNNIYETSINYNTYSYETTGFDGEGQITSAIAYVTSEGLPTMYVLEGHNETQISASMQEAIEKENIKTEDLNLLTAEQVPDDADILFIYSPQSDLSSEEKDKIITYLKSGGKALITSDYTGKDMPNFEAVLQEYGVQTKQGVVVESDANHYAGNPLYLVPNVSSGSDITESLTGRYTLLFGAQAVEKLEDARTGLSIQNLLTTSDSAYVKEDVENMQTLTKEDGEEEGSFPLAVAISETVEASTEEEEVTEAQSEAESQGLTENESETGTEGTTEGTTETAAETVAETDTDTETETEAAAGTDAGESKETKLVYISSGLMFDDQLNSKVSGANMELFTNALGWMCDHEVSVSIPSKSTQIEYLTLTAASARTWSIVTMILLPVLALATGGVIWFKRRRR